MIIFTFTSLIHFPSLLFSLLAALVFIYSLCQAHHVCVRTLPLRWWALDMCRPHGVATSTHCFLYNWGSRGNKGLWDVFYFVHFFSLFLSNWCFFLSSSFCRGRCPKLFFFIYTNMPLSYQGVCHHWFSQWSCDGGKDGIAMNPFFPTTTNPACHLLSVWLSASKVTGLAQDWPSKWIHSSPNPSLSLNLLYSPLTIPNKLFTNSHFISNSFYLKQATDHLVRCMIRQ